MSCRQWPLVSCVQSTGKFLIVPRFCESVRDIRVIKSVQPLPLLYLPSPPTPSPPRVAAWRGYARDTPGVSEYTRVRWCERLRCGRRLYTHMHPASRAPITIHYITLDKNKDQNQQSANHTTNLFHHGHPEGVAIAADGVAQQSSEQRLGLTSDTQGVEVGWVGTGSSRIC